MEYILLNLFFLWRDSSEFFGFLCSVSITFGKFFQLESNVDLPDDSSSEHSDLVRFLNDAWNECSEQELVHWSSNMKEVEDNIALSELFKVIPIPNSSFYELVFHQDGILQHRVTTATNCGLPRLPLQLIEQLEKPRMMTTFISSTCLKNDGLTVTVILDFHCPSNLITGNLLTTRGSKSAVPHTVWVKLGNESSVLCNRYTSYFLRGNNDSEFMVSTFVLPARFNGQPFILLGRKFLEKFLVHSEQSKAYSTFTFESVFGKIHKIRGFSLNPSQIFPCYQF